VRPAPRPEPDDAQERPINDDASETMVSLASFQAFTMMSRRFTR
jgi:hypothetical protein